MVGEAAHSAASFFGARGAGALLEVKVLSLVDHSKRSEAQLHEGDRVWGGSVERNCEPMDKYRIDSVTEQGERASLAEGRGGLNDYIQWN